MIRELGNQFRVAPLAPLPLSFAGPVI